MSSVSTSEDQCGPRGQQAASRAVRTAGSAVLAFVLGRRRCWNLVVGGHPRSRRRRIFQFMNFVSFGIPRFCGFRDFEDFEFRGICNSLAFPCSAAATSCGRGSGARGARARGRVFRTRFRASSHARDAPRSLRSNFGKIENLRFRNFGSEIWAAFALPCP